MNGLKLADEFCRRTVLAGVKYEGLVTSSGEIEVEGFETIGIEAVEEVFLYCGVVIENLQGVTQPREVFGINDAILVSWSGDLFPSFGIFTPAFEFCPLADWDDPAK